MPKDRIEMDPGLADVKISPSARREGYYILRVIDSDAKLAAFLPALADATWLALDTEADSLHAYPEKVCLIQISTTAGDRLIDPLARVNLEPLFALLKHHELIMHGADYDLRLLHKHHAFRPRAIFDTMLAARLLGERQFGLGSLVERFLGVKLDKGPQKADWARRPLTERMEVYARNDTHYLKPLSDKLRLELQQKNRLAWHRESCARLIGDCLRPPATDGDSAWRVKGSYGLSRPALAVLRELWRWRETEAVAANRPPFFILSHEKLVALAGAAAGHQPVEPLLPLRLSPRRWDGLTAAIRAGLAVPHDRLPEKLRHYSPRPTEAEMRRYCELERCRDAHAHRLGIDPTVIAPRATLGDLARNWDRHAPELMNWQRELLQS
ncbi:MAG TPA: HRDC domain-containing protein [Candidatus Acidoferrum sp.]|nr:HRDC domain-containing protein [Candidatus Acidoferrum sp.]